MSAPRRKPDAAGFGHHGGSNLADYLNAAERSGQIELEMDGAERLVEIPVDRIDRSPFQARVSFDSEGIEALGEDIRANGLNHPMTVREASGGRYELVAGERRWLAARAAGQPHVLARVRQLDDFAAHLVGVSENNRRANLSPWEMSLEAARLLEHAKAASQPHTQRDLARYLNRNVSLVNQQLAVAAVITVELLSSAEVKEESVCRLPHVTLHRIAKLPEPGRLRALREAIRMQQSRAAPVDGEEQSSEPTKGAGKKPANSDDWSRLWENGGFHFRLRQPLRTVAPDQAKEYLQRIAPAFSGLARRVSEGNEVGTVLKWDNPHGHLIFVRASQGMPEADRAGVREAMQRVIDSWTAAGA